MEKVTITDLNHQGKGIGRIENKIVFVPNTLPNEIVEIEIIKNKKNFMEGKVISILQKSPKRIESLCPYYPKCGGCQLLHMPYAEQLSYKQKKMKNILTRYGLETVKLQNIIASPKNFYYRNKATFQNENNKLGYFEEESYHFIPIESCLLLDEKINHSIKNLPTNQGKIIVRSNQNEVIFEENKKIIHTIVDYHFAVSIPSFFQINDSVTPLLYEKVKEYLHPTKEDIILDLYCGTGTIGIFISKECKKVIGIEISKEAIIDAKENAKRNRITNIEFICGDAGKETKKLKEKPTGIIIDPPRSGLNKETIHLLLQLGPKKIVYVSCDPMTLVRDLNILKEKYDILEITPFDMFPNTYHVENVVLLSRKENILET